MSICVIYNPHAGRRRAQQQIGRIQERYQSIAEFRPTSARGHAQELARHAADEGFDIVAAAGGDGTVHEVANGLLRAARPATLAVIPVGSANDFAYSIRRQFGVTDLADGKSHPIDVGLAETPSGKSQYFVEGIGLGLAGMVTVESQKIRGLRGMALYGLAAWRALKKAVPNELEIRWNDEAPVTSPTLMLSALLGQREGNFLMAPKALVDDGQFDVVHVGRITRWGALRLIPRLAVSGPPQKHPEVRLRQCGRLHIRAQRPLVVHVDGEVFASAPDAVTELAVTILPRRLVAKVVDV
jgi:diacylglycerol kinase (ATP)